MQPSTLSSTGRLHAANSTNFYANKQATQAANLLATIATFTRDPLGLLTSGASGTTPSRFSL